MKDYQIAPEDMLGEESVQEIIKTEGADDVEKLEVDHISTLNAVTGGAAGRAT